MFVSVADGSVDGHSLTHFRFKRSRFEPMAAIRREYPKTFQTPDQTNDYAAVGVSWIEQHMKLFRGEAIGHRAISRPWMTDIARLGNQIRSLNGQLLSATKSRHWYRLCYSQSIEDFTANRIR
jgi:hypothetical protein